MTRTSPSVSRWLSVLWSPVTGGDLPFGHWSVIRMQTSSCLRPTRLPAAPRHALPSPWPEHGHATSYERACASSAQTRMGSCVLKIKVVLISLRHVERGPLHAIAQMDGPLGARWVLVCAFYCFHLRSSAHVRCPHMQCHPILRAGRVDRESLAALAGWPTAACFQLCRVHLGVRLLV